MARVLTQAAAAVRRDGLASLGAKGLRYAHGRWTVRAAIPELRRASEGIESVADAVEVAFGFREGPVSIVPFQFRSEIAAFVERVRALRPRAVLQIGTCTGGTLFLLTRFAASDAVVVSVDLPHGSFGGGYSPWLDPLFRSFARDAQRVRLVLGDSHAPATLACVREELGGRPVDVLFVDGDHAYEGVARDYELYAPLVRPGGIVAFHDIVPGPPENVGGVPGFWRALKQTEPDHEELVESWDQGSAGIGVIRKQA
jgi:predicted O-methyltransferase YrrM